MNTGTMKNVFHKKKCNVGVVQLHVDPPLPPLIKSNHNNMFEKDFVNIKMRTDPPSENFDLYEFKMDLFNNGDQNEFLLLITNLNMTIEVSGALGTALKVQYHREIVCG